MRAAKNLSRKHLCSVLLIVSPILLKRSPDSVGGGPYSDARAVTTK